MSHRDARVNRLCTALCERVGLAGWWTLAGPSPVALMASCAGRRKSALEDGQWTALQLAFAAWRLPLILARRDYWPVTVADLLLLDRRTMRHVSAFMRGLARLGGAL
jgi:hypothetical protein